MTVQQTVMTLPALDIEDGTSRRRRVLAIMHQFPPSRDVGAQSCAQICRYLPDHGWDPIVLTVKEKYIARMDHTQTFSGTVIRTGVIPHPLSLYQRVTAPFKTKPQESAGAPVARTDGPQESGSLRRWILSILGIPDPHTGWIPPAVISGIIAARRHKVECLFS